MKEIIEIFRMQELSIDTRIKVIKKLGEALNWEHGSNWTNDVVEELVNTLNEQRNLPENHSQNLGRGLLAVFGNAVNDTKNEFDDKMVEKHQETIAKQIEIDGLNAKRIHEAVHYCYHHGKDQMWSAMVMGLLLGCEFRDSKRQAEAYLRRLA